MAITPSSLTAGVTNNIPNSSGATTAAITPSDNALVLLSVTVAYDSVPSGWNGTNDGSARNVFTPTRTGLTFVRLGSVQYGARRCTELFRAMGSGLSSEAIAIACSDLGGTRDIAWIVHQFTGVITTGSDGADAVGTPVVANNTGSTSLALGSLGTPDTGDLSFGHVSEEDAQTVTRETDYSLIANVDASDNVRRLQSIYRDASADVTPSWSWSSTASSAALGCLIKAAAAGGTTTRRYSLSLTGVG